MTEWVVRIVKGVSLTDLLVTALTKLGSSHEAIDSRLNETSKKFKELNTALRNQLNNFFFKKKQIVAVSAELFFTKPR